MKRFFRLTALAVLALVLFAGCKQDVGSNDNREVLPAGVSRLEADDPICGTWNANWGTLLNCNPDFVWATCASCTKDDTLTENYFSINAYGTEEKYKKDSSEIYVVYNTSNGIVNKKSGVLIFIAKTTLEPPYNEPTTNCYYGVKFEIQDDDPTKALIEGGASPSTSYKNVTTLETAVEMFGFDSETYYNPNFWNESSSGASKNTSNSTASSINEPEADSQASATTPTDSTAVSNESGTSTTDNSSASTDESNAGSSENSPVSSNEQTTNSTDPFSGYTVPGTYRSTNTTGDISELTITQTTLTWNNSEYTILDGAEWSKFSNGKTNQFTYLVSDSTGKYLCCVMYYLNNGKDYIKFYSPKETDLISAPTTSNFDLVGSLSKALTDVNYLSWTVEYSNPITNGTVKIVRSREIGSDEKFTVTAGGKTWNVNFKTYVKNMNLSMPAGNDRMEMEVDEAVWWSSSKASPNLIANGDASPDYPLGTPAWYELQCCENSGMYLLSVTYADYDEEEGLYYEIVENFTLTKSKYDELMIHFR
ncbi:MAG: hypothetical protein K6B17_01015 [Treponema sp.]|nr:hypothetical protein [Treponema sp.]